MKEFLKVFKQQSLQRPFSNSSSSSSISKE